MDGGDAQAPWTPIDIAEGETLDEHALKELVRAAITYNRSRLKKPAAARSKAV